MLHFTCSHLQNYPQTIKYKRRKLKDSKFLYWYLLGKNGVHFSCAVALIMLSLLSPTMTDYEISHTESCSVKHPPTNPGVCLFLFCEVLHLRSNKHFSTLLKNKVSTFPPSHKLCFTTHVYKITVLLMSI